MKKILITGFEPFLKEKINPSQELVALFASEGRYQTQVLPVSYEKSWTELASTLQKGSFDFVLMLGQAGSRKKISFEKAALNQQDAENADEEGVIRLQTRIEPQGPDGILNPLPLRSWVQSLEQKGCPVEVSFSAGSFVCNTIYFRTLLHFKDQGSKTQCLFVHVPFSEEQISQREAGTPFMKLETMKWVLDELLKMIEDFPG